MGMEGITQIPILIAQLIGHSETQLNLFILLVQPHFPISLWSSVYSLALTLPLIKYTVRFS